MVLIPIHPAVPTVRMKVGFNYAWSHGLYGAQIGPNPWVSSVDWNQYNNYEQQNNLSSIPNPPMFDHIEYNLKILKDLGITVVRWFLLGDGLNYGPPQGSSPTAAGFTPPPRCDRRFKRDFEKLLKIFQSNNMLIIPSLIDHLIGYNLNPKPQPDNWLFKQGRADIIKDPYKSDVFFKTVLKDLLDASVPYINSIFAWEVINEPSWLCKKIYPSKDQPGNNKNVPKERIVAFLNEAINYIENYPSPSSPTKPFKGKSTVGHRYYSDLSDFPTGEIRQFHYYAEQRSVITRFLFDSDPEISKRLFNTKTYTFLGEFNTGCNRQKSEWEEKGTKDSTLERLKLLENNGCPLALIWPDLGQWGNGEGDEPSSLPDEKKCVKECDFVKLIKKTRADILQFTMGTSLSPFEYNEIHDPNRLGCCTVASLPSHSCIK